jgi:hypothetical protein
VLRTYHEIRISRVIVGPHGGRTLGSRDEDPRGILRILRSLGLWSPGIQEVRRFNIRPGLHPLDRSFVLNSNSILFVYLVTYFSEVYCDTTTSITSPLHLLTTQVSSWSSD